MDERNQERRDCRFAIGLVTGTVVGAGLAIWFSPQLANQLRGRVVDVAKNLRGRAGEAIGELTKKGQGVRDDVAGAVARGAHEVERYAASVGRT
jgi:gas vesicle protein